MIFLQPCREWTGSAAPEEASVMKKTAIALPLCCAALVSLLLWQQRAQPAVTASDPLGAQEQEARPLYLVRVTDGELVIYPYGSDTALERTDIRLSSLREYDQKLMQQGFPLYSEQELASFLEDFGS